MIGESKLSIERQWDSLTLIMDSFTDCRTKNNWTKSIAPRQKVTGQKVSDIGQKVFHLFI